MGNARLAILVEGPLEILPYDDLRRQFDVNVVGPVALPDRMRDRLLMTSLGLANALTAEPTTLQADRRQGEHA